jgi:hypothetical protein
MSEIVILKQGNDDTSNEIVVSFSDTNVFKNSTKKKDSGNAVLHNKIPLCYNEVPFHFLYHLHGSWIKTNKIAGFLKKVSEDTLVLHSLHEGLLEVSLDEGPFYVKKDDMNYSHLLFLVKDHEKSIAEERQKLASFKKRINDMLASGKMKLT